jgi:hypothetical protein
MVAMPVNPALGRLRQEEPVSREKKKIRKENKSMSKSLAQPLKGPVAINFESTNP